MHVATKAHLAALSNDDAMHLYPKANTAAHAINDILENWGNASREQCEQRADRLRALADLVDGHVTARGNENTYSY